MDDEPRGLLVIDCTEAAPDTAGPVVEAAPPMTQSMGYELDTVEKARRWLTDPAHWHDDDFFILKWEGLLPTVMTRHGERLVAEPWDDGLPMVVVQGQAERRRKREKGEELAETRETGSFDE